jgi:hypothetical protein
MQELRDREIPVVLAPLELAQEVVVLVEQVVVEHLQLVVLVVLAFNYQHHLETQYRE